jgi:hypothetical protein
MIKMDMDQAAVWLGGSILTALGFVVLIIAIVFINNILHKYWKPVNIFTPDSWKALNPPQRFVSQEELGRVAPELNKVAPGLEEPIDEKKNFGKTKT